MTLKQLYQRDNTHNSADRLSSGPLAVCRQRCRFRGHDHLSPSVGHPLWVWPLFLCLTALAGSAQAETLTPSANRIQELVHLVRQDCGSCHGMTLQGGLGPALTPSALNNRSEASLAAAIYHGRPGTPMPPWRPFLSEAEAQWIAARLKAGDMP